MVSVMSHKRYSRNKNTPAKRIGRSTDKAVVGNYTEKVAAATFSTNKPVVGNYNEKVAAATFSTDKPFVGNYNEKVKAKH